MTRSSGPASQRCPAVEKIYSAEISDIDLSRVFDFHDTVSRWTGGRPVVLGFLDRAARRAPGPMTMMEMGCGRGDLSRAIVLWARRSRIDVRIHGVDRNPRFIAMAREWNRFFPEITFECRELGDPFFLQAQQFDHVVSEGALHREEDDRTAAFLKTANLMARRGIIAVDWLRDPRPALVLEGLARLWRNPVVRHDARVSVERGFRLREAETLRSAAGLEFARVGVHFGYRFSISGERGLASGRGFIPVTGLAT